MSDDSKVVLDQVVTENSVLRAVNCGLQTESASNIIFEQLQVCMCVRMCMDGGQAFCSFPLSRGCGRFVLECVQGER